MSTMVERVARAICENSDQPWESAAEGYRKICIGFARTAIEAMREPEVEMLAAFWRQKNTGTQEIGETGDNRSDYDAWDAAIAAAIRGS